MSLEREVAQLKEQVRALQQAMIRIVGGIESPEATETADNLSVRELRIVDDLGRICIRLHATDGRGRVDIHDAAEPDDSMLARLGCDDAGGSLTLYNRFGYGVAELCVHRDGEGELTLRDSGFNDHTRIGCNQTNSGLITLYSTHPAAELTADEDGRGALHLYSGEGPHASIEADSMGDGCLRIFNHNAEEMATIEVGQRHTGRISITNQIGNEIVTIEPKPNGTGGVSVRDKQGLETDAM